MRKKIKKDYRLRLPTWIRAVALLMVAVFVPAQVAWAGEFRATEDNGNCGVYALADLLRANKINIGLRDLADQINLADAIGGDHQEPKSELIASLYTLNKVANFLGLKTLPVKIELNQADNQIINQLVPFIAHINPEHFVYVSRISRNLVYYRENQAEKSMAKDLFFSQASGYLLTMNISAGVSLVSLREAREIRGGYVYQSAHDRQRAKSGPKPKWLSWKFYKRVGFELSKDYSFNSPFGKVNFTLGDVVDIATSIAPVGVLSKAGSFAKGGKIATEISSKGRMLASIGTKVQTMYSTANRLQKFVKVTRIGLAARGALQVAKGAYSIGRGTYRFVGAAYTRAKQINILRLGKVIQAGETSILWGVKTGEDIGTFIYKTAPSKTYNAVKGGTKTVLGFAGSNVKKAVVFAAGKSKTAFIFASGKAGLVYGRMLAVPKLGTLLKFAVPKVASVAAAGGGLVKAPFKFAKGVYVFGKGAGQAAKQAKWVQHLVGWSKTGAAVGAVAYMEKKEFESAWNRQSLLNPFEAVYFASQGAWKGAQYGAAYGAVTYWGGSFLGRGINVVRGAGNVASGVGRGMLRIGGKLLFARLYPLPTIP